MKKYKIEKLIVYNIILLIPLILYGVYKNGYLIYQKDLINFVSIFKPIFLVLIGIIIKFIIDIIRYKKIKIDYNLVYVILIGMIMPYNINLILYSILLLLLYLSTLFLEKHFKFNKIYLIYLILILSNLFINSFTFESIIDQKYTYSFEFLDILMGRSVGGISSTSILFSLVAYILLINNFYYKKDIPLAINITYLLLAGIYCMFTENYLVLINSDLIFGSIFISALPEYTPYKVKNQIIYGIFIGMLSFVFSITLNSIISIYLSTLIASVFINIKNRQKVTKLPIA